MHAVSDIFAHSSAGVVWDTVDEPDDIIKAADINELKNRWNRLTHGERDEYGKWDKNKNFADCAEYLEIRVNSAKTVCANMLATCIKNKKEGSISIFKDVKYHATKAKAQKYEKNNKKKKEAYLRNSYGIIKLSKYLKPSELTDKKKKKKLKKIVNSVSNNNVKKIFKDW